MSRNDPRRFLGYLEDERNAALLYRALAETVDGERRAALLELAQMEDAHAEHWATKLADAGIPVPAPPEQLSAADARMVGRARGAGFADVLATLEQAENQAQSAYDDEPEAPESMAADERSHAEAFRRMIQQSTFPTDGSTPAPRATSAASGKGETWHRSDRSGATRAAVFGISDGLVSNTALVMGFAGASPDNRTILFAGVAGLLAGAFSMAAGEYVSVASQRDLFRREIQLEAEELRSKPEEEQRELELIYRAKGLSADVARQTAAQIMGNPKTALDTLAREELGLDPDELGSPVKVALSSFAAFAIGAVVVVLPYLFFLGPQASSTIPLVLAIALAVTAMLAVGGLVGRLSGRGVVFSALRQLMWGAGAAGVTFVVGTIIGVNIS
ncbi:MAG: VIT1/CCC1 transporter family protein [Actinomycetales bacterium]|nr:VIT1/CCC1 transporter family protein [Actinomycetales bacterium]